MERSLAHSSSDSVIIVYAGALKALCATRGLIDMGVSPQRIKLVRPLSPQTLAAAEKTSAHESAPSSTLRPPVWSLGDTSVDTAITVMFAELGIGDAGERLLEGVQLSADGCVAGALFTSTRDKRVGGDRSIASAERDGRHRRRKTPVGGDAGEIGSGVRAGHGKAVDDLNAKVSDANTANKAGLACEILLCGDTPNADPDVFRAANNSGLVYDGRLVVDPLFRTSDPTVLAGGTLTKLSRTHGDDMPRHEEFNAREVNT